MGQMASFAGFDRILLWRPLMAHIAIIGAGIYRRYYGV
jgi:hypothetical protein